MKNFVDKNIVFEYFKLKEIKYLADGTSIPNDEKLRKVSKRQKGMFMVETITDTQTKKYFWVKEEEVNFTEKKKEFLTADMLRQQYREKNGIWI